MSRLNRTLVALIPALGASMVVGTSYATLMIAAMAWCIAYVALGE